MAYYEFFGLTKEPFQSGPSVEFLYMSPEHEECLSRILVSLSLNSGLCVTLGDAGTGKTSLSNLLIDKLIQDGNTLFAVIRQPRAKSEMSFLEKISNAFGIPSLNGRATLLRLEDGLFKFVEREGFENKKKIVLIIDEGQEMTPTQLLRVRELLNMETVDQKLINVVIFAQLEFLNKISTPRFKNFRQRVAMSYILNPLGPEDTKGLIEFRLKKAGLPEGETIFTDDAINVIHSETNGLARDICKLASYSLLSAYTQGKKVVDGDLVTAEVARIPIR
ncbi:MAG: AAA family ATPase [bacterium]|nr:AAA family ATPase [bacterium]